jgi:hypothetical protein
LTHQLEQEEKMKYKPFFNHRRKESHVQSDTKKSETIFELHRLEGTFVRLRNLSILGKERAKISDRERSIKMEGYVEAFAYAADLVGKVKKNLIKKQHRNHKIETDEIHKSLLFVEGKK